MEDLAKISALLDRYLAGNASLKEQATIETWYLSYSLKENNKVPQNLAEEDMHEVRNKLILYSANSLPKTQPRVLFLWKRIATVAAASILLVVGIWFISNRYSNDGDAIGVANSNGITPGREGATLTLADGKKIILTNAASGELAQEAGVTIIKSANGKIVYSVVDKRNADYGTKNTLSTAKGETYKIQLPDGSGVWLNAASSLTFPVTFHNAVERKVELSGEGYFEIAKDKTKPFRVVSKNQTVEVLGTHFNINSYEDEVAVKTTLVEGRVKVIADPTNKNIKPGGSELKKQEYILNPDQQAVVSKTETRVISVDSREIVTWTKGIFMFNDKELESILRDLSRWYNVDIEYQDESLKNNKFWGIINKYDNLSKVLLMLEKTKIVKFKVVGNKVIVKNNNHLKTN